MIRTKRPAGQPDGGRPSPSSSPPAGGAEEAPDPNPPAATTPEDSSADGDPNTPNPPSKTLSVSSPAAGSLSTSPNKRPKPSPPPTAAAASGATSRRSDRKRKPRELLAGGAGGGGHQKQSVKKKVWGDPDEVALLKAAVDFRSRTGDLPRRLTMGRFFDSIKGTISPFITLEQVGYKLKRLKGKYVRWVAAGSPSGGATSHDRLVNELSAQIWAAEAKQSDKEADEDGEDMEADAANRADDGVAVDEEEEVEEEEEGAAGDEEYPFIKETAENHWKGLGNYNAFVSRGLELIDHSKAKVLEEKLRKQCEAETLLLMKRLDLLKELSQLLVEANKSSRF